MRGRLLRRLTALGAVFALAGAGCAGESPAARSDGARYLADADFRRAELDASLVAPGDGYARLRLERYGRAWEELPVWNPRVEAITAGDVAPGDATRPLGPRGRALAIDAGARAADPAALLRLGQEAFFAYPTQLLPDAAAALGAPDAGAGYGFVTDPATGQIGGLVRAEMADGSSRIALTCASCHAGVRGGRSITGAPNQALDLGRLAVDAGAVPPDLVASTLAWGPGRLDVSSADASEPARIPDLRPVRFLTHLHQDATVEQRSLASLAIRLETLIVTSHQQGTRPPREVALGLAVAVWALADALPEPPGAGAPGLAVLQRACASCHEPDRFTGPPVALDVAGTDPTLGLSPERGTGSYRVPSLRGVGSRGPLLHDASAPDLATFFDPARLAPGYQQGRAPGPIPGHVWNLDLSVDDRAALLATLSAL